MDRIDEYAYRFFRRDLDFCRDADEVLSAAVAAAQLARILDDALEQEECDKGSGTDTEWPPAGVTKKGDPS